MRFTVRFLSFFVVTFLSVFTAFSQTVLPRDDNQFWNETQVIKPTGKNKELIVIGVLRTGRDFARPVDERIGAGFNFKMNKHLSIIPTYVYVDQQPYDGRRIQEHRLILNATIKFNAGAFAFMDRNLLERRVRHSSADFTVYRNRLQIDHPAKIGSFKFKPFIADEIWYSTQTSNGKTSAGSAIACLRELSNNSENALVPTFFTFDKMMAYRSQAMFMLSGRFSKFT